MKRTLNLEEKNVKKKHPDGIHRWENALSFTLDLFHEVDGRDTILGAGLLAFPPSYSLPALIDLKSSGDVRPEGRQYEGLLLS